MWIAIDTAGGDHGPEPIVQGALMALRDLDINVILIGDEKKLKALTSSQRSYSNRIQIKHAPETVTMEESPAKAVRNKPDSSIMTACRLVKEKEAIGLFSPGNTGATMAAALFALGRLEGVKRPIIGAPIPRRNQPPSILLDAGANTDSKPEYLLQSAVMGEIYSREVFGILEPRVGILSNGEEENKGNELTLKTFQLIKKQPFRFVGNIEGRDIFGEGKKVDVIVTDGFTGNVVVKTIEGTAQAIFNILKNNIKESALAQTGALLLKPTLQAVKSHLDHSNYGGVPLLGVGGIVIVGHGSSNAWAVRNALEVTQSFASHKINQMIVNALKNTMD